MDGVIKIAIVCVTGHPVQIAIFRYKNWDALWFGDEIYEVDGYKVIHLGLNVP